MARIELAPEVLGDLDRFLTHLVQHDVADAPERLRQLMASIDVLSHSPELGRPVRGGLRELVMGQKSRGYVALYCYLSAVDMVLVLAIRSQREDRYKRANIGRRA
jgi:toxin ParE1/3/4